MLVPGMGSIRSAQDYPSGREGCGIRGRLAEHQIKEEDGSQIIKPVCSSVDQKRREDRQSETEPGELDVSHMRLLQQMGFDRTRVARFLDYSVGFPPP